METARAHGVGDKWGLFASHLPQRVGYQCSAYYRQAGLAGGPGAAGQAGRPPCRAETRLADHAGRCSACLCTPPDPAPAACPWELPRRDVIIPMGLVIDRRFRMTRNGRAVYVG